MNSKRILKITILLLFTIFFNSCSDNDKITFQEIEGINDNIYLIVNETKNYELSGGNGEFSIIINNPKIVKAVINYKRKLTISAGSTAGTTEAVIKSEDKVKTVKIKVVDIPEDKK